MPRNLAWKKSELSTLKDYLNDAKGVVIIDFKGMNVEIVNAMRREFKTNSVKIHVSKNTLLKKAIEENPKYKQLIPLLKGPTAIVISSQDAVVPCALLKKFYSKEEKPAVKGGVIDGAYFDEKGIDIIAGLPSKEVLLGQVVAGLQSPISKLVFVLNGVLRNFVSTIEEIRKQKQA
ncbi:MAG: 50S ribosomal protein L10 [Candidatus Coatesbacteria bacterium]|nr:50S ribosomal protein L10 [Candidatus Coatesbacteria bacterium]